MKIALRHRGPDGEGTIVEPGVGLGHCRLAIIDLSTGAQPMSDPVGTVSVVFNGEIYNFRELRTELESTGHRFVTQSDTEVLIHGYLASGIEYVRKLVGMFAIAIWDRRTRELFLVRDRLGVKPLYWTELPGASGIAFASELTALRAGGFAPDALNRTAVCNFAALGYMPDVDSAIEGVRRLEPAHYLRWTRETGTSAHCYWDLGRIWRSTPLQSRPEANLAEEFLDRLDRAVARRLVSDVPLGALLSGGLDSSTVCALVARHTDRLKTFSAGFEQEAFNELPFARAMAAHLGAEHAEEVVSCESPDLLLEVVQRLDEPFADTSIVPTYVICRAARRRVTVALTGDGGDELLAGYTTHAADTLRRGLEWIPAALWRTGSRLARLLPEPRTKVGAVYKLKAFLRGAVLEPDRSHASWRMLALESGLRELFQPDFWSEDADPFAPSLRAYAQTAGLSPLDRNLFVDYKTWLPDDILTKADRASMAHGLEIRSPFLDHELIEYCAGLPPHLKLRWMRGKRLLVRSARGLVPARILRRTKRGFNAPVSAWIAGSWRELVCDTLGAGALQQGGILNGHAVSRLLKEHLSGRRDHGFLLFALLVLAIWIPAHQVHAR